MISLKSKNFKKSKNIKGGVDPSPPLSEEDKKIVFDALFDLLKNIYDNDDFKQAYNQEISNVDYNTDDGRVMLKYDLKMTYLYFVLKYFFSLLFSNYIQDSISNKELLERTKDFIHIIYTETKNIEYDEKQQITINQREIQWFQDYYGRFFQGHVINPIQVDQPVKKSLDLYVAKYNFFLNLGNIVSINFYNDQNKQTSINLYNLFFNTVKLLHNENTYIIDINKGKDYKCKFLFSLQTDLYKISAYDREHQKKYHIYYKYDVESLIMIIYNFIITNIPSIEDFQKKCASFTFDYSTDLGNYTSNEYSLNEDYLKKLFTLFADKFKEVFLNKLKEKEEKIRKEKEDQEKLKELSSKKLLEFRQIEDVGIKGLFYSEIDKLYKQINGISEVSTKLKVSGGADLSAINNYILIYSYYNALNEFEIAIEIIKKITNTQDYKDIINNNEKLNNLYLLLVYYYYTIANNYYNSLNSSNSFDLYDFFNLYINNLLLCIKYLNIYSNNTTYSNTDSYDTSDAIIKLTTNKFEYNKINIIEIYKLIIENICKIIANIKEDIKEDIKNNRDYLLLLEFAYYIYKLFFGLKADNPIFAYLKDKEYDFEKNLSDEAKYKLLNLIIEQIKRFDSLDLLRIFFFKQDSKSNSKLYDIDETREYQKFFEEVDVHNKEEVVYNQGKFKNNIFTEVLNFDKKYPLGFDVVLSIYKYSYQISDVPSEEQLKKKYKSYLYDVFNNEEKKNKEQYEYLKTLLNTFYMNISVLFYNLFINDVKKFNDLKSKITGIKDGNKEIQDDFKKLELEEKNKSNIILTFIKHLKKLFQGTETTKEKERIEFIMILFNHIYTCSENDILKFIYAMYSKLLGNDTEIKINEE